MLRCDDPLVDALKRLTVPLSRRGGATPRSAQYAKMLVPVQVSSGSRVQPSLAGNHYRP